MLKEGKSLNSQMNDTGAAEHFVGEGHDFDRDLELFLLESGGWRSAAERERREHTYASFRRWNPAVSTRRLAQWVNSMGVSRGRKSWTKKWVRRKKRRTKNIVEISSKNGP